MGSLSLWNSRHCKRQSPFVSSALCFSCLAAIGMLWLGYAARNSSLSSSGVAALKPPRTHRILAYGDSLTAGTSYPDLFPYASFLQASLEQHRSNVVVRHRGLPGWTTQGMLDDLDDDQRGLRTAIQAVTNPSLSLVILLAGTNDLAYGFTEEQITNNLLRLHAVCKESGVPRTLTIGIPPSGYQATHEQVADLVRRINENLHQFTTRDNSTIYVPFPFDYEKRGENWHADSLHFSEKGYQVLGESLAATVEKVLQDLDSMR